MSNIYIYEAGDGAWIAGCHALGTRGRAQAVPSGCAGKEAGLAHSDGHSTAPRGGQGVLQPRGKWNCWCCPLCSASERGMKALGG